MFRTHSHPSGGTWSRMLATPAEPKRSQPQIQGHIWPQPGCQLCGTERGIEAEVVEDQSVEDEIDQLPESQDSGCVGTSITGERVLHFVGGGSLGFGTDRQGHSRARETDLSMSELAHFCQSFYFPDHCACAHVRYSFADFVNTLILCQYVYLLKQSTNKI